MSLQHSKIITYLDLIRGKTKKNNFFVFDDGRKFIVNGKMVKLIPPKFHHLYQKDEFYLYVNPDLKLIMFYAFDENIKLDEITNPVRGYMAWEELEISLYQFFVNNLENLTSHDKPHMAAYDQDKGSFKSHTTQDTPYYSSYTSSAYKEREAFYDTLISLLKEYQSTKAIDHINDTIGKMCEDKKFEDLDVWLRMISFEKLNMSAMLQILRSTKTSADFLKERNNFFDKVKTFVSKAKASKADLILREFTKPVFAGYAH